MPPAKSKRQTSDNPKVLIDRSLHHWVIGCLLGLAILLVLQISFDKWMQSSYRIIPSNFREIATNEGAPGPHQQLKLFVALSKDYPMWSGLLYSLYLLASLASFTSIAFIYWSCPIHQWRKLWTIGVIVVFVGIGYIFYDLAKGPHDFRLPLTRVLSDSIPKDSQFLTTMKYVELANKCISFSSLLFALSIGSMVSYVMSAKSLKHMLTALKQLRMLVALFSILFCVSIAELSSLYGWQAALFAVELKESIPGYVRIAALKPVLFIGIYFIAARMLMSYKISVAIESRYKTDEVVESEEAKRDASINEDWWNELPSVLAVIGPLLTAEGVKFVSPH